MFCKNCGSKLGDDASFCESCNAVVERETQTADETPATETPADEAPGAESPVAEAPVTEPPVAEMPAAETPADEASVAETSAAEVPAAEVAVAEIPAAETADAEPVNYSEVSESIADQTKKSTKKLIISITAVVAALALVVGSFFFSPLCLQFLQKDIFIRCFILPLCGKEKFRRYSFCHDKCHGLFSDNRFARQRYL